MDIGVNLETLGDLLTSKKISDPMSKLNKEYAPILSLLSQLNKESNKLYKQHAMDTYLREGKVQAIFYLVEDYRHMTSTIKQNAIKKKIKEIMDTLSPNEEKELSTSISNLIPKTILKSFVSQNKLKPELEEDIRTIIDIHLPIEKDKWSQLFTAIGTFEDTHPVLEYLRQQRKRLIKRKEWNDMIDKSLLMPLLSGNPSTINKWILVVYMILDDELFDLLPSEEAKNKIYKILNK